MNVISSARIVAEEFVEVVDESLRERMEEVERVMIPRLGTLLSLNFTICNNNWN